MVVPQSAALESQDGATKESIVLSRIRMLDARLSNGDKSSPSAHTRKYVHPFNRAAKTSNHTSSNKIIANSSQPQAQHPTESRDTDSSSRPNQISHRETILSRPSPPKNDRSHPPIIDTDQEHLLHIRNSSPRGDRGSPLRRDDTVHTFQSSQVKPTVERNASPAKPIRYSPSPIPSRTINIQTSPVIPDNNHGSDLQKSRGSSDEAKKSFGDSPFKATHPFNELHKKKGSNEMNDASPIVKIPASAANSSQNVSSAEKNKVLPSRVALHFARNEAPSPNKTRTDSPAKDTASTKKEERKSRALSPAGSRLTLQRHHWDKGNTGSTDNNSICASSPQISSSTTATKPAFALEIGKGSGKVKQDPSPRNANQRLAKPEPEPEIVLHQSLPFQTKIQREYRKIPPSPKRRTTAVQQRKDSTLERNLSAASAVMSEERASSVGSSSSSGRSGLSQSELGGIAAKALALSNVNNGKNNKPRHGNTTLQQIVDTKRTSNFSSRAGAGASNQTSTVPYAYSSAQRLSERLTRAERFSALKNAKQSGRTGGPQGFHQHDEPNPAVMSDNYTHPVFGYSKNSMIVNTTLASEEKPVLSPEPSCVRRSKHLSKALQNKANQFALASPSRRSKGNITELASSHGARNEVIAPTHNRSYEPTYLSQEQNRFDPLGLQGSNRSLPQKHGSFHRDEYPYKVPTDKHQQQYFGPANHRPAGSMHNTPPTLQFQPKYASKQPLGLNRTVDQRSGHPSHHDQHLSKSSGPSPTKDSLTPGQKLEILAREQRSKFQEDQTRYRNINVPSNHNIANVQNDDDTNYSGDGVSSVDGDIFYDEPEPVLTNPITAEPRLMSNQIWMNQVPHDCGRQVHVRSSNDNLFDNRQSNAYSIDDIQQSYRHISKRPEPLPVAHPSETPATACDNTFTGSLNKPYTSSTPVTLHDNTFTGSLNPNMILSVNDSSDSSAAKPDAFRWLHQKYGNQATIVPEVEARNHSKPNPVISKLPIPTQNIGNEDDDDVFFGIDEVNTEDDREQSSKERSLDRMPSPMMKQKADYTESPIGHGNASNAKTKVKKCKNSPRNFEFSEVESIFQSESDQAISLQSEIEQKKRHRPFPVETKIEEARVSGPKSLEREETIGDDDSEQDENKPPPSVLKNLGSVIVKSIQRACAIPEELPDIGACAMNTKMKCEEKISEAWVGLDEDENATHGDASRTSKTTDTGGVLNENDIGDATSEQDERSQTSESSSNIQSHEKFMDRRIEAEKKLLHHAETAMAMFGNNNVLVLDYEDAEKLQQKATLSTDSSTTQGPKPLIAEASIRPTSTVPTGLSVDHRMVLQAFSTCLKKGGVEVLKLSRWNIWQVRYLTISREALQLSNNSNDANDAAQCPKALLWLKQTGKSVQNRSLSGIKDNGRGGMLFETMKQVVPIESNEYYDRNLPKRLKKKFPEFAGVLVHYILNGNDRHVHFCFKNKQDAQSFTTTMRIIQDVGKRTDEIESTPTIISSETKSHDS